jgi:membrane-bound lytic murein transglycosylase B
VGHLADRITNDRLLHAQPIKEPSLNRKNILFIQEKLNELGFNSGKPDGISGPKTRTAVRRYQFLSDLPVDGYVGYELFKDLSVY